MDASTVASGELSCQISLANISETSVAGIILVGLVSVPTEISPPVPVESDAEALAEGEIEADGLLDAEGDSEGLAEDDGDTLALGEIEGDSLDEALADGDNDAEGEREADGLKLALAEGLILGLSDAELLDDGEVEAEGLTLRDSLADAEELGDTDGETDADAEAEGDTEAEAGPNAVITLAKSLTKTAPDTENKVPLPSAPLPSLPSKETLLVAKIDQSLSVTLALFRFC